MISWILNSVFEEISASIIFADSAQEIWLHLKDRFQQSNGPRIFQLRRDLINHCQGQTSVSVYFTKLKALWEELNNFRPQCVCGKCSKGVKKLESFHQMDYVLIFLMGLNDSFAQVRSQILLLDPLPSINKVFALIVHEERQRTINSQASASVSSTDMAFAVKNIINRGDSNFHNVANNRGDPNFRGIANNRGNSNFRGTNRDDSNFCGVANKNRFSNMNQNRERPFCTICKINDHTMDTCYKIPGYPPGYSVKKQPSVQYSSHYYRPDF